METQDTIVQLGDYAEAILTHPLFNAICDGFEQSSVQAMLSTKPGQEKEREEIFASISGARDFITYMREFVKQKNNLLQPPVQDIDDPAVHDIYREQD